MLKGGVVFCDLAPTYIIVAHRRCQLCVTTATNKKIFFFLFFFLPSRPAKESERVQPVTVPDLDLGSGEFGGNWYARDLAYGADSLIENLAGEMGGGTGWLDGWMGRLIYWGGGCCIRLLLGS